MLYWEEGLIFIEQKTYEDGETHYILIWNEAVWGAFLNLKIQYFSRLQLGLYIKVTGVVL